MSDRLISLFEKIASGFSMLLIIEGTNSVNRGEKKKVILALQFYLNKDIEIH